MRNILIAGGAGFIGSNLAKRIVNQGRYDILVIIDNLYTGNINNLKEIRDKIIFIEDDITSNIEEILIKNNCLYKFTEIYNAACPASPPAYQYNPINTTLTCVVGTNNLLNLSLKHSAKFMQFSTSEVYGEPDKKFQNELDRGNVNPNGIRACYDEGKRCAESLCMDYYRKYNCDIRIIRIFNTYGELMDAQDGRVISNFINQALTGEDITIYGDGKQSRSFCYITDLLDGIESFMSTEKGILSYPVINLGNPKEFTILELAKLVLKLIPSKSKIIFKKLPNDDPTHRCPDISKANRYLNFEPKINLEEGLQNTINYYKERL